MSNGVRDLVLVGAGGLARETAEAIAAVNEVCPTWRLRGLLDDDPRLLGSCVAGLPVLGPSEMVHELANVMVCICVASPTDPLRRSRVARRLDLPEERYGTVVHPNASLGGSTSLGHGVVVLAGVVATADVRVGQHVVLMPQVVLTHDDEVADGATCGAGVRLAGGVSVGSSAYLGSGCCVREGIRVGEGAVLAMGAVALAHVPAHETWGGVPAHRLSGSGAQSRRVATDAGGLT